MVVVVLKVFNFLLALIAVNMWGLVCPVCYMLFLVLSNAKELVGRYCMRHYFLHKVFRNKVAKIEKWFLEVIWGKKYSVSDELIIYCYQVKCYCVAVATNGGSVLN